MRDPEALLSDACAAMTKGDAEGCQATLDAFWAVVEANPLDPAARLACERQLAHLRGLAQAALEGLDEARAWMRELSAVLGGLDVYDRGGRQRVATGLSARMHRF